jgi:hypothetical protein
MCVSEESRVLQDLNDRVNLRLFEKEVEKLKEAIKKKDSLTHFFEEVNECLTKLISLYDKIDCPFKKSVARKIYDVETLKQGILNLLLQVN